jgi:hypothetical protein
MTREDWEFVIACCMGDGHIAHCRTSYCFRLTHGTKQLEYISYKATRLNAILGKDSKVVEISNNGYPGFFYQVCNLELFGYIHSLLYNDRKKRITEEILNNAGLETLAVLWMDDGSLSIRKKLTTAGNLTNGARIGQLSVYENNPEDLTPIINWVENLTKAKPYPVKSKGKYRLTFNATALKLLIPAIEPFCSSVPSMFYKLNLGYKNILTSPNISDR